MLDIVWHISFDQRWGRKDFFILVDPVQIDCQTTAVAARLDDDNAVPVRIGL